MTAQEQGIHHILRNSSNALSKKKQLTAILRHLINLINFLLWISSSLH